MHINYTTQTFNRTVRAPDFSSIEALLVKIDPDVTYPQWLRVLMAIFNESKGSEEGFNIANDWSSNGMKYKGEREIRTKWRSFRLDAPNRVTIATLYKMTKGNY